MAFAGSDTDAAVAGDFAMTRAEIPVVLRALRAGGIHVVALHNHMLGEQPRFYFTHFWGKGPAAELARALRAALDAQRDVGDEAPDSAALPRSIDFESMQPGESTEGFSLERTGRGQAGAWRVSEDPHCPEWNPRPQSDERRSDERGRTPSKTTSWSTRYRAASEAT